MVNKRSNARILPLALNLALLVVMLVVNTQANALPLGGRTTGEISDSFNVLFVPAGYVFSIWGLIYLGLIGFSVFQALPAQQANPAVRATDYWFALTSAANTLWVIFWHYGYYTLTLVMMLILLGSLIVIYRRLAAIEPANAATRWLVHAPFSLYLGWISVATIANAGAVLVDLGWDGRPLNPVIWTVVMIAAASGLSLLMSARHRDLIYTGVIVWALVGILVRQAGTLPIAVAVVIGLAACLLGAVAARRGGPTRALQAAR
jgi:hypothetical protein